MSQLYNVNSGTYEPVGPNSLVRYDELQKDKALESAVYIGDEWDILPGSPSMRVYAIPCSMLWDRALTIHIRKVYCPPCLRWRILSRRGMERSSRPITDRNSECRHVMPLSDDFSVKAGFNTMRQYIHKVSNTAVMSPTDTWKQSDPNIKPQRGWQVAGRRLL